MFFWGMYILYIECIWYFCSKIFWNFKRQVAGGKDKCPLAETFSGPPKNADLPTQQKRATTRNGTTVSGWKTSMSLQHFPSRRKIAKKFDKSTKGGITLSSWCFGDIVRSQNSKFPPNFLVLDRNILDLCSAYRGWCMSMSLQSQDFKGIHQKILKMATLNGRNLDLLG